MPSLILNNLSGGQPIFSGQILGSGRTFVPQSQIRLRLSKTASGNAYIGLSGKLTIGSGNMSGTGSGNMDGIEINPGETYNIPRGSLTNLSGTPPNVFALCDAACSGQARLGWEMF